MAYLADSSSTHLKTPERRFFSTSRAYLVAALLSATPLATSAPSIRLDTVANGVANWSVTIPVEADTSYRVFTTDDIATGVWSAERLFWENLPEQLTLTETSHSDAQLFVRVDAAPILGPTLLTSELANQLALATQDAGSETGQQISFAKIDENRVSFTTSTVTPEVEMRITAEMSFERTGPETLFVAISFTEVYLRDRQSGREFTTTMTELATIVGELIPYRFESNLTYETEESGFFTMQTTFTDGSVSISSVQPFSDA